MYSKKGRYVLMVLLVSSAALCYWAAQYQLAAVTALFFFFLLWSHYKQSSVAMASKFFKNQDYDKTQKYLDEVPNPDRLSRARRGYYEFMKGTIALHHADYEAAEYHFQVASRFPVGGNNQKAYVLIHLANLALRKKDALRATTYAEKAKELSDSSRAQEIINKIQNEAKKMAN